MLSNKTQKSSKSANNRKRATKTKTVAASNFPKKKVLVRKISSRLIRRREKRPKQPRLERKLTGSFRLFSESLSLLAQHWKLFGGITMVYLITSILLVGILGGNNQFMENRQELFKELGKLAASLTLFNVLISTSAAPASESGAAYQTIVIIIVSLATIWALRQSLAGERVTIRDSFYKGVYPLIPFVIVIIFLGLLLIPLLIAGFVLAFVFGNGLAISPLEIAFWSSLILFLAMLSLYLFVNRIFALYIVALPDMKPMAAIKAARKLVIYHRWSIIRKLLFLPFALFVIGAVLFLPLITYIPTLAPWLFLPLYMFTLIFVHTYIYSLYKELL